MRQNLINNINEIKKYYKKRISKKAFAYKSEINNEFKEWINDSFNGNEEIWTLPDLTRSERLDNFCRSINKRIK